MNTEILKKNIVIVPVIVAILSGTFASIRYVINLNNSVTDSKQEVIALNKKLVEQNEIIKKANQDISQIFGVIQMSKEIMEIMGSQISDLQWEVRDLTR
jgi:hypothetical protein